MKRGLYIGLLILLLLVAGYFFFFKTDSTLDRQYSDFAIEDTSRVTKIFIADPNGQNALLTRRPDNKWTINNKYQARQDAVNNMLKTISAISVKEPVSKSSVETIIKLLAVSSTKVEIYTGGDKPEKVYYVGHATKSHEGTNMLLEVNGKKSSLPYVTHIPGFFGYLSTRFFTEEHMWKNRAIFEVPAKEIAKISLEYTAKPTQSFELLAKDDVYSVLDFSKKTAIDPLEEQAVLGYLEKFRSVHYELIEQDNDSGYVDSILNSNPIHIVRLEKTNGDVISLKTFYKPVAEGTVNEITGMEYEYNVDRLYALVNEVEFVVMQWPILDELLFNINDFRRPESVDNL